MRHRGQTRPEKSGNVVHSAARQRSTLCRSTTYRAQQASRHGTVAVSAAPAHPARRIACRWRGSRGRHSVGRSRPQRAIYCAIEAKKYSAPQRPRIGRWPACPTHPGAPGSARADRVHTVVGMGGGYGRRSRMSGERQAVCARRVVVQRPQGVGWGVVEPHEVGTNTKESKIANRLLKSRWHENVQAGL